MDASLLVEREDRVATLTINRESRRNALDHITVGLLRDALADCTSENTSVVILRGAGTKAFCAGDDLKAYAERTPEQTVRHFETALRTFEAIEEHPCLVIAAIEGYCLGGGLELAVCCDYRIAGEGASFGLPEVRKLSALPSWGGLTRLPKLVGLARARELVLLGERIQAEQAKAMGLVSEVVVDGTAFERALRLAKEYAAEANPTAVAIAKQAMVHAYGAPRDVARFINELAERVQRESDDFGLE
jgi:enoyl-CoA hydratase/carnithine racemase